MRGILAQRIARPRNPVHGFGAGGQGGNLLAQHRAIRPRDRDLDRLVLRVAAEAEAESFADLVLGRVDRDPQAQAVVGQRLAREGEPAVLLLEIGRTPFGWGIVALQ
jgi:hypothetical protein